jgi:OmpA-OmpF porin, OOP family
MRVVAASLSAVLALLGLTALCVSVRRNALDQAMNTAPVPTTSHEASFALLIDAERANVFGAFRLESERQTTLDAVRATFPGKRLDDRTKLVTDLVQNTWSTQLPNWITRHAETEGFAITVLEGSLYLRGITMDAETKRDATNAGTKAGLAVIDGLVARPPSERATRELAGFFRNRSIEFEPTENVLSKRGEATVAELALVIKKQDSSLHFEVIGHTDNEGDHDVNVRISDRRARAVKTALAKHGISVSRLHARGAGPDEPAASNRTAEGRRRNRRIDVRIDEVATKNAAKATEVETAATSSEGQTPDTRTDAELIGKKRKPKPASSKSAEQEGEASANNPSAIANTPTSNVQSTPGQSVPGARASEAKP